MQLGNRYGDGLLQWPFDSLWVRRANKGEGL